MKREVIPPPYLNIARAIGRMSDERLADVASSPEEDRRDMRWRYRCAVTEQERRRRGCKGCGEPVERGYWCSDSCFYAEDGWLGAPEQEEEQDE